MVWALVVGALIILFGFMAFFGAPYVPSRRRFIERAFEHLYRLGRKDVLVDVGSGDGVVLRAAAPLVKRAVGYEINPVLVVVSRLLSRQANVHVRLANFWVTPLDDEVTIVYAFSVSRDMPKLVRKLQAEADRLNRELLLMTYGPGPKNLTPEKTFEAYELYRFHPLHPEKPQV